MKINVNGLSVYLNGDKKNTPIVFVHAFPHDRRMWMNQIDFLSKDFFVISYDVRGFGESETGCGQFTMEKYADDLLEIIKSACMQKPVVVGLSMGGYIMLRALEKQQEAFAGAVLMDTRSEADDNAGKLKRANAIKDIETNGLVPFAENFVKNCVWEKSIETENEGYLKALEIAKSQNPTGVIGALLAMVSRTDTSGFLSQINIPVSVVCGRYDALTPVESMKKMSEQIPDSEFHIVENAGHLSNLENPAEVNKIIFEFANKVIG